MRRLALAALLLAGCAGHAGRSAEVCVPPGAPPLVAWTAVRTEFVALRESSGAVRAGVVTGYLVAGRPVLAYWLDGAIASVDPAPEEPGVPFWRDRGLVDEAGLLRPGGRPACAWARILPGPKERE